jgi:hypothetical protein
MKHGKLSTFLFALIFISLGVNPVCNAAIVSDPFEMHLNSVSFYLVDDSQHSNDLSTTLTISQIPKEINLAYSFDAINYSLLTNSKTIALPNGYRRIYFGELSGNNSNTVAHTKGDVIFSTFEGVYHNLDSYVNAIMDFGGGYQIAASSTNDNFAPVPIPSAILLLGTGLICLIGFRDRVLKS